MNGFSIRYFVSRCVGKGVSFEFSDVFCVSVAGCLVFLFALDWIWPGWQVEFAICFEVQGRGLFGVGLWWCVALRACG